MKLRTYGRTELAQCYNPQLSPDAAWRKLRQWIALAGNLEERLAQAGYHPGQRTFTPKQVEMIVQALGDP